jgi:phage N-6-adenine-methyltransferase
MFSKASDEWATPQDFFDALDGEFRFGLDAAATEDNAKTTAFLTAKEDALSCDWAALMGKEGPEWGVWLNPPYSRCSEFMAKAREESLKGLTVVCLVPARTDTKWWHEWVYYGDGMWWPGVEVRFIKGRLKFGEGKNSAPFPSVVIIFRPPTTRALEC